MQQIPKEQVERRIQAENCWWAEPHHINLDYVSLRRRAYFDLLLPLVREPLPKRAVLLMGPRRVGKTVLMHQVVQQLIADGVEPKNICYFSVDHPIFNNLGLDNLLELYAEAAHIDLQSKERIFIF